MSTDDADLAALLQAVLDADEAADPADNERLSTVLGWDLEKVALGLQDAKDRQFIWGQRDGRKPAPWFSSLEVTVQGKRFLRNRP
jgi:hypothetical protein